MWFLETNTFNTPFGVFGTLLWDLRCRGGLPIVGEFYKEYIHSNRELYYATNSPNTLTDLRDSTYA